MEGEAMERSAVMRPVLFLNRALGQWTPGVRLVSLETGGEDGTKTVDVEIRGVPREQLSSVFAVGGHSNRSRMGI